MTVISENIKNDPGNKCSSGILDFRNMWRWQNQFPSISWLRVLNNCRLYLMNEMLLIKTVV